MEFFYLFITEHFPRPKHQVFHWVVVCQWSLAVCAGFSLFLWDGLHSILGPEDDPVLGQCTDGYLANLARRFSYGVLTVKKVTIFPNLFS